MKLYFSGALRWSSTGSCLPPRGAGSGKWGREAGLEDFSITQIPSSLSSPRVCRWAGTRQGQVRSVISIPNHLSTRPRHLSQRKLRRGASSCEGVSTNQHNTKLPATFPLAALLPASQPDESQLCAVSFFFFRGKTIASKKINLHTHDNFLSSNCVGENFRVVGNGIIFFFLSLEIVVGVVYWTRRDLRVESFFLGLMRFATEGLPQARGWSAGERARAPCWHALIFPSDGCD